MRSRLLADRPWQRCGTDDLPGIQFGPNRTDFSPSQAISPAPSGTLKYSGLFGKSAERFGSRSVANSDGLTHKREISH